MPQSILLSLSLYSGFSILGIVTVFLLPIETKGRALQVRKILTGHYVYYVLTTHARLQKGARLRSNHPRVLGYSEINGNIFKYPYLNLVDKWGPRLHSSNAIENAHDSQSSRENATPSHGTSLLAYY